MFPGGNDRASRLLFLLACYHCGIEASARWHEGKHDPWPTLNFLLFILTQACKEFEQRVGQLKSPRGEKTEAVLAAVERQISTFRVADLRA